MRHARSYARENAVLGLYGQNIKKDKSELLFLLKSNGSSLEKFKDRMALDFVNDITANEKEINKYIEKNLKKWSLSELNPVVLSLLQVGIYEVMKKEIDASIIISDILKIANDYLDVKEIKFIHYVLDRCVKDISVN